jgi:hypothetical protein
MGFCDVCGKWRALHFLVTYMAGKKTVFGRCDNCLPQLQAVTKPAYMDVY